MVCATNWMTLYVLLPFAAVVLQQPAGPASAAGQTSSFMSAAEYWAEALPGLALPAVLRQRVTALDGSTALVAQLHQSLLISSRGRTSSGLCAAGHLYCNAEQFNRFRRSWSICTNKSGFRFPVASVMGAEHSKGDFFRESTLVKGAHMVLGDQLDRTPMAAFLPRKLAEVLHPASAELLQAALGIPAGSLLAKESVHTCKMCQVETQKKRLLKGEEACCAMCLEDLADQLKARFAGSSKVELLPVSVPTNAAKQQLGAIAAKVVEVELRAEETQPYLACHARTYPFAVHFCHHIPNTRIYSAKLQTVQPAGNSNQRQQPELFDAVAICHLDTSGWNPRHVAFADLHSSTGRTDACHWTHENGLVFVPAAAN